MKTANFTNEQYVTATGVGGLTTAFGTTSGAIASVGSGAWAVPGFLAPDAMTVSFSGMIATIGLPSPWALVSSGGVVVRAHGTQTGQDTNSYSVNFAPLVPGGGSVTAYLAATIQLIQQAPFPVPGPPRGHPSFNPNYVPSVGYAQSVFTVALTAVTGGIDNINTFEILRTTLTAGQSILATYNTFARQPAAQRRAIPSLTITSGGTLVPAQAQYMIQPSVPGLTFTLPSVSGAAGLLYGFTNPTTGTLTIAANGADLIAGFYPAGSSSVVVPASGSLVMWGNGLNAQWDVVGFSPNFVPHDEIAFNSNGSWSPPFGVSQVYYRLWAGGGGGGGTFGSGSAGAGGGGAGYVEGVAQVSYGTSYTVVIASGGAGGTGGVNGTGGGISSFSTFATASGGTGGQAGISGAGGSAGNGGAAVGGTLAAGGGQGGPGLLIGSTGLGGQGGSTFGFTPTPYGTGTGSNGTIGNAGTGGANGAPGGNGGQGLLLLSW